MKSLNTFLKALEQVFSNKRGFYVPKYTVTKTKVNCIVNHTLEVWCIDSSYKTNISSISKNYNINDFTDEQIKQDLITQTIINILKYYGL